MRSQPLSDAFAKTEWAVSQIDDLNQHIRTFFQSNPYEITSKLNADRTERIWRFRLKQPIPRQWAVNAGSILHTLRSPLDQLACAIAVAHGRTEAGVCFPFGRTIDEFKTELAKQKKLPPDAKALIAAAKPYPGGNEVLWALHHLNRRDKHRVGLVPVNLPQHTTMAYLRFDEGLGLVLGCKTGKHLILGKPRPSDEEIARMPSPKALYKCPAGTALEFGDASTPGDESLEFLTTTPGAKFETDFKPALNVCFRDVGLDRKPVVAVLNEMRHAVERVLLAFERRFFPKG